MFTTPSASIGSTSPVTTSPPAGAEGADIDVSVASLPVVEVAEDWTVEGASEPVSKGATILFNAVELSPGRDSESMRPSAWARDDETEGIVDEELEDATGGIGTACASDGAATERKDAWEYVARSVEGRTRRDGEAVLLIDGGEDGEGAISLFSEYTVTELASRRDGHAPIEMHSPR